MEGKISTSLLATKRDEMSIIEQTNGQQHLCLSVSIHHCPHQLHKDLEKGIGESDELDLSFDPLTTQATPSSGETRKNSNKIRCKYGTYFFTSVFTFQLFACSQGRQNMRTNKTNLEKGRGVFFIPLETWGKIITIKFSNNLLKKK